MPGSIQTKVLLLLIPLLLITSLSNILISYINFERKTTELQYSLARENIGSSVRIVNAEYSELINNEINIILRRRELMKNTSAAVNRTIDSYFKLHEQGILTKDEFEAQCLEFIKGIKYSNNQYFFVCDNNLIGLIHPNPDMVGKNWTGYRDLKGQDTFEIMNELTALQDEAFTVFNWQTLTKEFRKHMGYFFQNTHLPWIIGTATTIEDIEDESLDKMTKILNKFEAIFNDTKLDKESLLFIVNGQGDIILRTSDKSSAIKNYMEDNRSRFESDDEYDSNIQPVDIILSHHNSTENWIVFTKRFKPLKWKIVYCINRQKISRPVTTLVLNQAKTSILLLIIGIFLAIVLSKRITKPLLFLANYTQMIANHGFTDDNAELAQTFSKYTKMGEVGSLIRSFTQMERELRQVMIELAHRDERLRLMDSELALAEERERRRLANQIHDHIGQSLVFIKLKLKTLSQAIEFNEHCSTLNEVFGQLDEIIRQIRTLTAELSPPMLQSLGLTATLEWLGEMFMKEHGLETTFGLNGREIKIHDDIQFVLYRSIRELLINVVKHAKASQAEIQLRYGNETVSITVSDNGVGFNNNDSGNLDPTKRGFGLLSIAERLSSLGGYLSVDTSPGQGTSVTVTAPLGR